MTLDDIITDEVARVFSGLSLPVMVLDAEQRFVFANAAYLSATHSTLDGLMGRKVFDAFPDTPERVAAVEAKFAHTLATGETTELDAQPFKLEMEDGSWRDLVWQATQDPIHNAAGKVVGIMQRATDITARAELERRTEAIGYELDHRVKNILAVVISIARITSRGVSSVPDFTASFIERLTAISRTNNQLAKGEWRGLTVRDVLETTLDPYRDEDAKGWTLEGPKVRLSLEATKDLSMVAHELATNAAKYGCLGDGGGLLALHWKMSDGALRLHWTETCSRRVDAPAPDKLGFGSRLFDMLPYVEVERDFRPEGLSLTITVSGDSAFA